MCAYNQQVCGTIRFANQPVAYEQQGNYLQATKYTNMHRVNSGFDRNQVCVWVIEMAAKDDDDPKTSASKHIKVRIERINNATVYINTGLSKSQELSQVNKTT